MARKLTVIMLGLVMSLAAGSVFAQETAPAAKTEVAPAPAEVSVAGEVVSVDLANSCLVVKQADKEVKLVVVPETKITKAEANIALMDIAVGQKVSAVVSGDNAVSITLE